MYITNTYGSGNILQITYSTFSIYYKYSLKGSQGQDSTAYSSETFNVTKEVLQLNRFKNTDLTPLLEENDSIAYLKTPAGVYTQLTIPAQDIVERIGEPCYQQYTSDNKSTAAGKLAMGSFRSFKFTVAA